MGWVSWHSTGEARPIGSTTLGILLGGCSDLGQFVKRLENATHHTLLQASAVVPDVCLYWRGRWRTIGGHQFFLRQ